MKKRFLFKRKSKTKYYADKIRRKMWELIKRGELDLGVWTPNKMSNRYVIKNFRWVLKKWEKHKNF